MGERRRALLIGVPHATDALTSFDTLVQPVQADLQTLGTALEASGYEVETLSGAGRAAIGTRIFEVSRQMPADGTLLLYFTGHGLRLDDTDYLVPADAQAPTDGDWQRPYLDSLLPADISPYLRKCEARTVLWLIDACRDAVPGDSDDFGSAVLQGPSGSRFAVMIGCSPGQQCGFTDEGSFFTRGLVEALGPMTAPQRVHEVYESVRTFTAQAARRHGMTQEVRIRYAPDWEEETRDSIICSGRHLLDNWRQAVTDDKLWNLVAHEPDISRVRDCLINLVDACANRVQRSQQRLPDPWADDGYPVRVLRNGILPLLSEEPLPDLSVLELAALIAAPFLREASWADKLIQAADASPFNTGPAPGAGQQRRHLEQVQANYPHIRRKLAQSQIRGRNRDEINIGLWLVHRWIFERFEEDAEPVSFDPADSFTRDLLGSEAEDAHRVETISAALRRLAAETGQDGAVEYVQEISPLQVRLPEGRRSLRARPLSALLRLAGTLALDVRTFPEIIADHLAVADPVSPAELINLIHRSLDWVPDEGWLHLDVSCPHQAIHASLSDVVERADRLAATIRQLGNALPSNEKRLLAGVPARITDRGLRPRTRGGQAAYEVPLLRFHLAQTEVRDMLMGRQLYGDPLLAIRELYQNAMDACRYRNMRWRYLQRKGYGAADWTAAITLVQGVDSNGPYIECRDNGVGMGIDQLKGTFTRAGSRFQQSRSFRREQAVWLQHDPDLILYPNSRFGIGVLSYFMIADQMTIVTRQVHPDGTIAHSALRVDIPSSGSLFRIQRQVDNGEDALPEGGTRVRLYLREDDSLPEVSCTSITRSTVKVSEFKFDVIESDTKEIWDPGVLRHVAGKTVDSYREAVPGLLWWVNGEGAILCDGIITDKKPFGYVLNLTGIHSGTLSVNRNELLEYDDEWAVNLWRRGTSALLDWAALNMKWLWELEEKSPSVARVVQDELRGKGIRVPVDDSKDSAQCALDEVGWFRTDAKVIENGYSYRTEIKAEVASWRLEVLRNQGIDLRPRGLMPGSAHHAVPRVGDAEIVQHAPNGWPDLIVLAADSSLPVADIVHSLRRIRPVSVRIAPPAVGEGDLDWIPDNLDAEIMKVLTNRKPESHPSRYANPDCRRIVKASYESGVPLGDLMRRCYRFAPFGLQVAEVPSHHDKYVCTSDDIALLCRDGKEKFDLLNSDLTLMDVWRASARLGTEPSAVIERFARFAWLGWTVPDAPQQKDWDLFTDDLVKLISTGSEHDNEGQYYVSWVTSMIFAGRSGCTFDEAEQLISRAAATFNIEYVPRSPNSVSVATFRPSGTLARFLSEMDLFEIEEVGLQDLMWFTPSDATKENVEELHAELRETGIKVPNNLDLIYAFNELSLPIRVVFSGMDPTASEGLHPAPGLTGDVLFAASAHLHLSLLEVWQLAETESARFGLTVAKLPSEISKMRPSYSELSALVEGGSDQSPSWKRLTPGRLAEYAHSLEKTVRDAYSTLQPLQAIGALIPSLGIEELNVLPDFIPSEIDVLAVGETARCTRSEDSLTALDLLSIAGTLGETISQTWLRIQPFLPLMPSTDILHAPDIVPIWQDFVILSVDRDGLPPALNGELLEEDIRNMASVVGETEDWVRNRLRRYAKMFDLRGIDAADTALEPGAMENHG
ncbi:caspase family protein [Streptomyces sp. NBC_01239]|uniref:HD domain-containing protein n=1 Tax=Streptomyces sp. NBC_01239 TaxID=2903792 RepID=UPI00224D6BC5|nr:caspase family protein [Streptomyces sp. NBC_01239]MCX4813420.1 caspase family protein [Streptomyces sp. NBC_01239]